MAAIHTQQTNRAGTLELCVELAGRADELDAEIRSRGGVVTVGEAREIAELGAKFAALRREYLGDIDAVRERLGVRLLDSGDCRAHLGHRVRVVEPEGPLPLGIMDILDRQSPAHKARIKVAESHVLAWVPREITLTSLSEAVGGQAGKVLYSNWFINHASGIGEMAAPRGRWILIPDCCPPGTKGDTGKNWADARAALAREYPEYNQPDARSFAAAIILYFKKTGQRLYEKEYAWCSDRLPDSGGSGAALRVGCFDASGLVVAVDGPDDVSPWRGCAASWNFGTR